MPVRTVMPIDDILDKNKVQNGSARRQGPGSRPKKSAENTPPVSIEDGLLRSKVLSECADSGTIVNPPQHSVVNGKVAPECSISIRPEEAFDLC